MPNVPPVVYHTHLSFRRLRQFIKFNNIPPRWWDSDVSPLDGSPGWWPGIPHVWETGPSSPVWVPPAPCPAPAGGPASGPPSARPPRPAAASSSALSQLLRLPELRLRLLCRAQNPERSPRKRRHRRLKINQKRRQTAPTFGIPLLKLWTALSLLGGCFMSGLVYREQTCTRASFARSSLQWESTI